MTNGKQETSSANLKDWQPSSEGKGKPFALDKCPPAAFAAAVFNRAKLC